MGIRLYPMNDNEYLIYKYGEETVAKAEKFEQWVESATLQELNQAFQSEFDDKYYLIYIVRERIKAYHEIHNFKLEGWGRLKEKCYEIIANHGLDCEIGSTEDEEIVSRLLEAMEVSMPLQISGLCWG